VYIFFISSFSSKLNFSSIEETCQVDGSMLWFQVTCHRKLQIIGAFAPVEQPAKLNYSVGRLRYNAVFKQSRENIIFRVSVSEMLAKSLGIFYCSIGNLRRSVCQRSIPATHTLDVFIHPVMRPQPIALALVTGQHLNFLLD
jgi:hypothetical protein